MNEVEGRVAGKRKSSSTPADDEVLRFDHPITIGTRVACLFDGDEDKSRELLPCKIVERRESKQHLEKSSGWEYYIHLDNSDRRLDQWVPGDNIFPLTFAKQDGEDEGGSGRKITRHKRRVLEQLNPTSQIETGNRVLEELEKAREEKTKVKNISKIVFGDYEISTWYFSPYPNEYSKLTTLYICAFCLKYMRLASTYARHTCACKWKSPPGVQLYVDRHPWTDPESKKGAVKVFEVDGMLSPLYTQNLCLLAKLFLDHKTLCFDVPSFMFYVLAEQNNDGGWELVGFFSKEKGICASEYNVACILVLPHHQRKGYGKFLIALSYELTKREGKTGTPERPLSDLGQVSYHSYWTREVINDLRRRKNLAGVTARDVAVATGIMEKDVIGVLKSVGMLRIWKGEHMVSANAKAVEDAFRALRNEVLLFKGNKLKWEPHGGAVPGKKEDLVSDGEKSPVEYSSPTVHTTVGSKRRASADDSKVSTVAVTSVQTTEGSDRAERGEKASSDQNEDKQKKVAPHRFTHAEIEAMKDFVRLHGLSKIRAPMNSPEGLHRSYYEEFANKLGIEFSRCKEKIKRMAGDMMVRENAGTSRDGSDMKEEDVQKGENELENGGVAHQLNFDDDEKPTESAEGTPKKEDDTDQMDVESEPKKLEKDAEAEDSRE